MLAPIEDFFNKFDTYIYTPVARKFDCSPRLVTECFLQNKKLFLHLDYMDIGLQKIIEIVLICMLVVVYDLTTNQKEVEKNLLQEKLLQV